jgi:hypothetical protein
VKRFVAIAAMAALTVLGGAGIAEAAGAEPGGGPAFGQHMAGMAPEHPVEHGAGFGSCVSAMARGGPCPHTH